MTQSQIQESPIALIFDLDGLLLDTETIARRAFVEACHQVGWYRTDMAVYVQCIGLHGPEIGEILKNGYGSDFPWEDIGPICQQIYHEFIDHQAADIKPGAVELLTFAEERRIPCGLATSSRMSSAETKLTLAELKRFFSVVVSGDGVERRKPSPEPYLTAAKRLNVDADRCWALEDSENGVRSAVSAGCTVFQVPDLVEPSQQLRELGHNIVESLRDVQTALKRAMRMD